MLTFAKRSIVMFVIGLFFGTVFSSILVAAPTNRKAPTKVSVFAHPATKSSSNKTLKEVARQLRSIQVLRASFEQRKTIKVLSRPLISKGEYIFAREVGVYWKTVTPFPAAILLTPKGLIEKDPTTGKVVASTNSKTLMKAMSQMFVAILAVDIEKLSTMFELYLQGDAKAWTLGLKPKNNGMKRFLRHIVLMGGKTVQKVQIAEGNGDQTLYIMSNVKTQPAKLSSTEQKLFQ